MYRLVLYALLLLAAYSILLSFTGAVFYSAKAQMISLTLILAACLIVNFIFSKIYGAPTNIESTFITALILFFVMPLEENFRDAMWLVISGVIAIASKYIIAYKKKHIFNPAAFGAAFVTFTQGSGAIWWVANSSLLPLTLILGLIVVKKIRRFNLFFSCVLASVLTDILLNFNLSADLACLLISHFTRWPIIFFASIMVTEPVTAPPTKFTQTFYGGLVGFLANLPINLGPIYFSPEISLMTGNIFSFAVSLKKKLFFILEQKMEIARDTYEFSFRKENFSFAPGQYLEWTLNHKNPDMRGIRRYFTIASSPTENEIRLGIKFNQPSSSFKKRLLELKPGEKIVAGQLGGDFVLPKRASQKLAFIAGGIGITPFKSMLKYLMDKGEKRDIILLYSNKTLKDISYSEFLKSAENYFGIKIIHLITENNEVLSENIINKYAPDWKERLFYISGPNAMVESYKKLLLKMGVSRKKIVTDYFPGYA